MDRGSYNYRRFRDNGDEQGLVEIIRDYKDGLIFYLNSFVGDINAAEDLCEDTFVLLGTKKPKDKGGASFKTWLYTIGRNIAIDHLRKSKKARNVSLESVSGLSDEETAFENEFIKEERRIAVHRAMARLKPEYRQVLWLSYFEGMSAKEISVVMKKNVHSVQTLAYRARNALKKQLEKGGFGYEEL